MSVSETIALIGWGAIGKRVAELLAERKSAVKIGAVAVRDRSASRDGLPVGAALIENPAELTTTGAGLVVEAAGRSSVLPWGEAALSAGMDFAVSSTSAFVDDALFQRLKDVAASSGAKLIIPPAHWAASMRFRLQAGFQSQVSNIASSSRQKPGRARSPLS